MDVWEMLGEEEGRWLGVAELGRGGGGGEKGFKRGTMGPLAILIGSIRLRSERVELVALASMDREGEEAGEGEGEEEAEFVALAAASADESSSLDA